MPAGAHTPKERAQRFPISLPVHYREKGTSFWKNGRTINISRTGILFLTDTAFPLKTDLDFHLAFPFKVTMRCQGTVVRSQESACAVQIRHFNLTPS